MNRSTFDTGQPHQEKVAVWVRKRLVEQREGRDCPHGETIARSR